MPSKKKVQKIPPKLKAEYDRLVVEYRDIAEQSERKYQELSERLAYALGVNNPHRIDEIIDNAVKLKDYRDRHEGAISPLADENNRLMYLIKVLVKDPILLAEAKHIEKRESTNIGLHGGLRHY